MAVASSIILLYKKLKCYFYCYSLSFLKRVLTPLIEVLLTHCLSSFSRNQGDRIEIFGLGETKYERKWIYLARRPRTWAPQNMGAPRTQGKVVQINSRFANPAIETDKHELSLGRCPGPTRTLHIFAKIPLHDEMRRRKYIQLNYNIKNWYTNYTKNF